MRVIAVEIARAWHWGSNVCAENLNDGSFYVLVQVGSSGAAASISIQSDAGTESRSVASAGDVTFIFKVGAGGTNIDAVRNTSELACSRGQSLGMAS